MIPPELKHLLDQIKIDPTIRLPLINLWGPPACGKTFVFNEMIEYMLPLPSLKHWIPRRWNYEIIDMVLIGVEGFSNFDFDALNARVIMYHQQMKHSRTVTNVAHWVMESTSVIQGALNYEIICENHH